MYQDSSGFFVGFTPISIILNLLVYNFFGFEVAILVLLSGMIALIMTNMLISSEKQPIIFDRQLSHISSQLTDIINDLNEIKYKSTSNISWELDNVTEELKKINSMPVGGGGITANQLNNITEELKKINGNSQFSRQELSQRLDYIYKELNDINRKSY